MRSPADPFPDWSPHDARVTVDLIQDGQRRSGVGHAQCTGAQLTIPVEIDSAKDHPFQAGAGQVEAEAFIVDHHNVIDDQGWTRKVNIVAVPAPHGHLE